MSAPHEVLKDLAECTEPYGNFEDVADMLADIGKYSAVAESCRMHEILPQAIDRLEELIKRAAQIITLLEEHEGLDRGTQ